MSVRQKSTTLYSSPFSKAYWRDAAMELKDTKMLVFAALMIAVRVAMKPLNIHLAPGLQINTAFLANAVGAMAFGPVMAVLCAIITDTLGCILFPVGPYFLPMVLPEIAGSVIFALLLYRTKITSVRVTLSRFLICFLVNILLTSPLMVWYYSIYYPNSTYILDIPRVIKNLFMFPLESLALCLLLSAIVPVTNRMGLTFTGADAKSALKFSKKDLAMLAGLFVIGICFVVGYLFYHYDTTSVSASYTAQQRLEENRRVGEVIAEKENLQDSVLVTTVEKAYHKFMRGYTTYTVSVYVVDEEALKDYQVNDPKKKYESFETTLEKLEAMSKSDSAAASKDGVMEKTMTVVLALDEKTGQVLSYTMKPEAPKE